MDPNNQFDRDGQLTDAWANDRLAPLRPPDDWQPSSFRGLAQLRSQRDSERRRQRRWSALTVGLVLATVPLMAIPMTRAFAQRCLSVCVQESSRLREFLIGKPQSPAPSSTFLK